MRIVLSFVLTFLILAHINPAKSQIVARLNTQCAIGSVEVPIVVQNLENIKQFQLKLVYDTLLLSFDTSRYHYPDFETETMMEISSSHDTITMLWNAYYGVNVSDGLLMSLIFNEIGTGDASFSWLESSCRFIDILNLNIAASYQLDGNLSVPLNSSVDITFEQFTIGCRDNSENGGCKAQAEVNIIGGTSPYEYRWYDRFNTRDSLVIGLCEDPVEVVITDAAGCKYGSSFDPVIYPAINPEDVSGFKIEYLPEEIYITKPFVEFSVDPGNTVIEKYEWNFGDDSKAYTQNAEHAYNKVEIYPVSLRTENIDGCDTTITENVEVKELEFCIPNVFTPNSDGVNDTWIFKILGSSSSKKAVNDLKVTGLSDVKKCTGEDLIFTEHFKSTELVVFDRSGQRVFDCTNCTENWDGSNLPDGVYFYVFTWVGQYSSGKEQGNVTILGSSN